MVMAVLLVVFLLALVLVALLLAGRLGRKKKVPVYVDDEPRDNIMPYYDEGMPSCFFTPIHYDLSDILLFTLFMLGPLKRLLYIILVRVIFLFFKCVFPCVS